MKLHATIQQAFNNGKGDCFFTKNNQYVCISRKNIELQNKLINEGYTLLSYSEVVAAAKLTEPVKPIAKVEPVKTESTKPTKIRDNNYNSLAYLDERSDADPGL